MSLSHVPNIALCVDVPSNASAGVSASMLTGAVDGLLSLATEFQMPVTWGVGDPSRWPVAARVRRASVAHELALLNEPSWGRDRSHFAASLARHVEEAANLGFRVKSLVLSSESDPLDVDLLVRHRIAYVRAAVNYAATGPVAVVRPLSARYGIWRVGVHGVVGSKRSWWRGGSAAQALAVLHRAVDHRQSAVLVFDLVQAVLEDHDVLAAARRVFRALVQSQRRQELQVTTLAALAARATERVRVVPQHSVLRRAA